MIMSPRLSQPSQGHHFSCHPLHLSRPKMTSPTVIPLRAPPRTMSQMSLETNPIFPEDALRSPSFAPFSRSMALQPSSPSMDFSSSSSQRSVLSSPALYLPPPHSSSPASLHQLSLMRPVEASSAAQTASMPGPPEDTFCSFQSIHNDRVTIRWSDGSTTQKNLSSFKVALCERKVNPMSEREWDLLCSMADRQGDRRPERLVKKRNREDHWKNEPSGPKRQQTTRATRPCKRQPAVVLEKKSSPTTAGDSSFVPRLHCPGCSKLGPVQRCTKEGCTNVLCSHCQARALPAGKSWLLCHQHGGPNLVLAGPTLWHGSVRPDPVRVQIFAEDVYTQNHFSRRVEQVVDHSAEDVDVVVLAYHSTGLTAEDHIQRIATEIDGRTPAYVLILSCWTDPSAQTAALQQLALHHPSTIFVTFRDPQLGRVDRFDVAMPFMTHAVLHIDSQPLVFLAELGARQPDMVMFSSCGDEKGNAALCGPLQVAASNPILPKCSGCSEQYEGSGRGRWKKGVPGVRRRVCRRSPLKCADLLIVSSRPPACNGKSRD